jgi:hypothetical protein
MRKMEEHLHSMLTASEKINEDWAFLCQKLHKTESQVNSLYNHIESKNLSASEGFAMYRSLRSKLRKRRVIKSELFNIKAYRSIMGTELKNFAPRLRQTRAMVARNIRGEVDYQKNWEETPEMIYKEK